MTELPDEVILDQAFAIWGGFVKETQGRQSLVKLWRLDGSPGELEFWCENSRLVRRPPAPVTPQAHTIAVGDVVSWRLFVE